MTVCEDCRAFPVYPWATLCVECAARRLENLDWDPPESSPK